METLGTRLKDLRAGQTQIELAKILGITNRTLSNYETSNQRPRGNILKKICDYFGITEEWLLTGDGPKYAGQNEKTADMSAVFKNPPKKHHIENTVEFQNGVNYNEQKMADMSAIFKLQLELIELLKEKAELIKKASELERKVSQYEIRIQNLEIENSNLREALAEASAVQRSNRGEVG